MPQVMTCSTSEPSVPSWSSNSAYKQEPSSSDKVPPSEEGPSSDEVLSAGRESTIVDNNPNDTMNESLKSNQIIKSSSIDEEISLGDIADVEKTLYPKQTKGLYSSEEALDAFVAHDENGDDWLKKGKYGGVKEDHDMGPSPVRLADAAVLLREELATSRMGYSFKIYKDEGESESESSDDADDVDPQSIPEDEVYVEKTHDKRGRDAQMETFNLPTIPNLSNEPTRTGTEQTRMENYGDLSDDSDEDSISKMKASYTLCDHADHIGLLYRHADLGYPTCPILTKADVTQMLDLPDDTSHESMKDTLHCTREYVKPMTSSALCRIYAGLEDSKNKNGQENVGHDSKHGATLLIETSDGRPIGSVDGEIVPVRTVAIKIRPDVLVGEVMDAMNASVVSSRGEVTKRQGGHLRALLPGRWVQESEYMPFLVTEQEIMRHPIVDSDNGMLFLPPIVIDAQLCARRRSRFAERMLLVRSYRISEGQVLDNGVAVCPPNPSRAPDRAQVNGLSRCLNSVLREAASLHQRTRKVASGRRASFAFEDLLAEEADADDPDPERESGMVRKLLSSPMRLLSPSTRKLVITEQDIQRRNKSHKISFDTSKSIKNLCVKEDPKKLLGEKLLSSFTETDSVLENNREIHPVAALSSVDWPYVQSTWKVLADCLNELNERKLAHSSLTSCSFGVCPSLPTLDSHYCSHIKEVCKRNMVASLWKSVNELESYAKEAEYGCLKLKQVLEPMAFSYEVDLPQVPDSSSLDAYPLDYEDPELSSPPWGEKVGEALNLISAQSLTPAGAKFVANGGMGKEKDGVSIESSPKFVGDSTRSEFRRARDAVSTVLVAFQTQFDEELSARLTRRNHQVMDRVAKVQAFMAECIMTVRGSYGINTLATQAADIFHSYVKDCARADMDSEEDTLVRIKILPTPDQVPLLSCRVVVGGFGAMCYVTYHQLLIVTKRVALFGGNHFSLVQLNDIDVQVMAGSSRILGLVPSTVVVRNNSNDQQLFSFRPATGAHLFKDFIDILRKCSQSDIGGFSSTGIGGLLNIFDEGAIDRAEDE